MSYSCPINFEKVDSNTSRLSSLMVATLVIAYLYVGSIYILYYLFYDFFMRLFCKKDLSLIFQMSKLIKFIFRFKNKYTDGGAKRLAGFFGITFVVILVNAHNFEFELFGYIVAGIFVLCSLMDAFFDFCVGCQIYHYIKKIYPSFMS